MMKKGLIINRSDKKKRCKEKKLTILKLIFIILILLSTTEASIFALNNEMIARFFKVEKFYIGNLTTGENIKIGYRFFNKLNRSVRIIIQDKNIMGNSGINIKCLELKIPENESSYVLEQSMLLTKSGKFTLPAANITIFFNNKTYQIHSNNLSIEIKGKDIPGNFITSIYQCNGIKRITSNYATSSSSHIIINNGNIYVRNNLPNPLDNFNPFDEIDKIDQYFDQQIQEMHKHIQQIMNTFFPQQQVPQYKPIISSNQTNNTSKSNSITNNTNISQTLPFNSKAKNNQNIKGISNPNTQKIPSSQNIYNSPLNKKIKISANKNSKINKILPWIKILILLIIVGLIITLIKLSKIQSQQLEDVETSKAIEMYRKIKSELETIKKIKIEAKEKDHNTNHKEKILRFKEKVAEFKDALIDEFSEILSDDIIENIDLYLYADKFSSLESAIKKLDQIFIQK